MEKSESVGVSEEVEKPTIKYGGVKAMPFIIGNETCEKLGSIGSGVNFIVYLTTVFNMKRVSAATLLNIFSGTSNLAPLLGAFLSDTYFGRYKTIGFTSISSLMGLFILTLTAAITKLHPPHCKKGEQCVEPTAWQLAFLLCGFGFLIVGAGGIRPCNLAFGADQFNPETESGKRGINSFFNWYYFTFTFAIMVSLTVIVYVQSSISWTIGLAIPAGLMFLAIAFFFWGRQIYVIVKPEGSPLTGVAQVFVAAMKKRRLQMPEKPQVSLFNYYSTNSVNSKLAYTEQFRFLDKAAIITPEDRINPDGSAADPWRLCRLQQVEEVKCVMRVLPIWATGIIFYTAIIQQHQYATLQAVQSDRQFGKTSFKIPAASYIVITYLTLTIWIPIYDRLIVPTARRITGKEGGITLLQRMGVGIFLSTLTMFVSALVEMRRRRYALTRPTIGTAEDGGDISSMSAFWLAPQFILAGLSEGFKSIGQVEFYYKQFPENMRSIAGSFFFCTMGLASYLSGFLVSLIHHVTENSSTGNWLPQDLNKGRLDYFYFLLASLGVVNFGYFLLCARWYRYKGTGAATIELVSEPKETEKHIV